MKRTAQCVAVAGLCLVLGGCAVTRSHDQETRAVQAAQSTGGLPAALAQHESTAKSPDDKAELLYNMERGELLRLNKRYAESTEAFLQADAKVQEWEDTAKTNPSKLLGMTGAALISERLKTYEGQDYEKVWLTTRLALNRLAEGNLEKARVDIKRTHEREAVIAELRAKDTAAAESQAKSKGVNAQGKELNGYPVETLNDPAVLALKNGYQNALSHYLAGFVYEVTNEPGLAAPGYRQAIELNPEAAVLEEGLRGLDDRTSFTHKMHQRQTDVLFVVEAGLAPARVPRAFTVPVPAKGVRALSISYPTIVPSNDALLSQLEVAGQQFKLDRVVDVNVMARRALKDEMPALVLRGITRAIAKNVVQQQLQKKAGVLGAVVGVVATAVTEQADDRMWRMLPGRVYVARGYLPSGEHQITINGRAIGAPVKVDGQYAVVPLRVYENQILVGEISSFGTLPQMAEATPSPVVAEQLPAVAKPVPLAVTKPAGKPVRPAAAATPAKSAAGKA